MDEEHLAHAVRYVSLNPVRARLVERAEDWAWPSVRAHLAGRGCDRLRPARTGKIWRFRRFPGDAGGLHGMLGEVTNDGNDGTADRRTGLGGADRAADWSRAGAAVAWTEVESCVFSKLSP